MIPQINPPYLKHIESQGYVFSHIFKSQISSQLRNDHIYQFTSKPITEIESINLYPKDDRIIDPFRSIHKWIFPSGIRILKPGEEKYTKVNQVFESKDISSASNIQDINYFCITDPSNNKIYRCVSGVFYEKISAKLPKDRKTVTYLVPFSYCVVSEHLFYHPMKQLIHTLISIHINSNEYFNQMKQQPNSGIFIESVIEDEAKFIDFVIQSVFHISEIKGHNHKFNINLTTDLSHPFLSYYNKNDLSQPFLNLICPSNTSFEHIIFNQSPSNLFHLVICLFLEYQIIITSSKQSTSNLFCENILSLIKPMNWKGLYYPTLLNSGFDYQKCSQPFLIGIQKKSEDGLERFQKQPKNRVIYDLDENSFISKPEDLPIPLSYKNYLIKNLNFIIADLRFWEEQSMTVEAQMKYKQYFYNFFLLVFHDVLNYFQKGSPPTSNISAPSQSNQNQNINQKNTKNNDKTNQASGKNQKPASNTLISQDEGKQNFISFGQGFFNQEEYIKSFGSQDQLFFQKVCQTQGFSEFVKQCFKSIDFKAEYVKEMKQLEAEYSFHQIFLYINDCRYLAKRQQDQTLNDKIQEVEQMQLKVIQGVANKQFFPEIQMCISMFCQEYLEGVLQIRSVQDIKTTARSQSSNDKQNNYPYGINQNSNQKSQQQIKYNQQGQIIQKDQSLFSGYQQNQRQGIDGIETSRTQERNPLFMCDISKIEKIQNPSANNIDKLDQKHYEQIITEMNLNLPQKSFNECERVSTNESYNDYEININNNKRNSKHFPNSLQLFSRQSNLEQRNNLENRSNSPEKLYQSKLGDNNLLTDRQYLGISNLNGSNANNGFILSHNTYSNTINQDDITTCSNKALIANNLSQTKLSPSNSVTQIGLNNQLNFLSNFIESQQQSTQQFNSTQKSQQQNEKSLFLNLQQGCFDLWGHYQEEGNLNVA